MMAEGDTAAAAIAKRFFARPTAKQSILTQVFHSPDNRFQTICRHLTIDQCDQAGNAEICQHVHFQPIVLPQTDLSLGHCSYLNTCHRTDRCKYLHFRPVRRPDARPFVWQTLYDDDPMPVRTESEALRQHPQQQQKQGPGGGNLYGQAGTESLEGVERSYVETPIRHPCRALQAHGLDRWARSSEPSSLPPAQWIDADINTLDFAVLGKFDVILADPPWDIHMSLPYVTMTDNSMRAMPVPVLQDEGFLFLWVTSRAMELGRECMALWGYTRVDEIVWVKVGQTQRLIRTGRTGHWLNHTKEHCLVGLKTRPSSSSSPSSESSRVSPLSSLSHTFHASHAPGMPAGELLPSWANTGLDTDVIVAEVRDTSRKPDELYSIIERLCPNGRKVELFGRRHNARPGWITVGNQLKGDNIVDADLQRRVDSWRLSRSDSTTVPYP